MQLKDNNECRKSSAVEHIANSIESETLEELSGHYNPATVEYILRRVAINLAIIADQLAESNGYVMFYDKVTEAAEGVNKDEIVD